LIVFESEEKPRAREQDPRRQEGQKSARAGWAEIVDGPVELADLTVVQDVSALGPKPQPWACERLRVMDESELSVLRERAESGDRDAVDQLIELAGERGDLDELRRFADQGNTTASDQLIEVASEQGNLGELRRLADQGNTIASDQLIELASEQGNLEELRRLADQGNTTAREVLEELEE
jgi:hypothetical protein